MQKKLQQFYQAVKHHLFETDDVFIYWPDFNKGILLLIFALLIVPGHLLWYVLNYASEQRIWLSERYHDYRIFTTWCQIFLTVCVLAIALFFKKNYKFRKFMGWFIPLYFGLLLIYSAHTVGIYSPAAVGGTLNILLIGFVFYKPKTIYSIMFIVGIAIVYVCMGTASGDIPYAPLFSEALNQSEYYKNDFWIQSMAILYLPILLVSALFFELLLRQWRRREQKIETLSQIDSLTNVYNRRSISHYIQNLQKKPSCVYAMMILDLDFFKKVNDQYGHDVGDAVLCRVAHLLKETIAQQGIVGRLGGEEFVVILPDMTLASALQSAEHCRSQIEQHHLQLKDGRVLTVTASFGVAMADQSMAIDDVSRLADQALYQSKEKGRNQVSYASAMLSPVDFSSQNF